MIKGNDKMRRSRHMSPSLLLLLVVVNHTVVGVKSSDDGMEAEYPRQAPASAPHLPSARLEDVAAQTPPEEQSDGDDDEEEQSVPAPAPRLAGVGPHYSTFSSTLAKANKGDAKAMFKLGNMYRHGQGEEKNPTKAFEWYEKAATQGHKISQYNVSVVWLLHSP